MEVLKDVQENIDFDKFPHQIIVEEKGHLEVEVSSILRENDISPNHVRFNTREHHRDLDVAMRIKKYDYVWLNDNDHIVAFWSHKDNTLYF